MSPNSFSQAMIDVCMPQVKHLVIGRCRLANAHATIDVAELMQHATAESYRSLLLLRIIGKCRLPNAHQSISLV